MASLVATTAVQADSTKAEEAPLHLNSSLAEEAPLKELSSLADSSKVYDIDEVVIVSQPKETMRLRQQSLSSTSLGSFQILKREYASNDWLHPNPAGYKAMGIYAADIIK